MATNAKESGDTAGDNENQPGNDQPAPLTSEPVMANKKKKRKKSGKGKTQAKRGPTALSKSRGTGFEEYFADPPMTPQEADEEKFDIYNPEFPFEERIQSCIQRFRSRRRLQGNATLYFNEYLFLGGVDANPIPHTGLSESDLKDLAPAERRDIRVTDTVTNPPGDRFYDGDASKWLVDFEGVAAGFFSTALGPLTGGREEEVRAGIGVVENFLRYVLHHDVCNEYRDNLVKALEVCDVAREEWALMEALRKGLPGQFNLAAADLVSGVAPMSWSLQEDNEKGKERKFDEKGIFYTTLALMEDKAPFARLQQGKLELIKEVEVDLEVISIHHPTADTVSTFKRLAIDGETNIAPAGHAILRPTTIKDGWVHPLSSRSHSLNPDAQVKLLFDESILANMVPGMKMAVKLCELNVGVSFIKEIRAAVPSFYRFLPQELMRKFTPPRKTDRLPPSIRDVDGEREMGAEE